MTPKRKASDMFSLIGKLANAAIGWALPGLSASALYIIAGLLVVGIPSAYAWHRGAEGKSAAVEREKAQCEVKIARMETAAERTISDILSSVDESTDASVNVAEYCAKHPTLCRSGE
jgi:hypothetical protein